jgi:hypothetical protein
MRRTRLQEQRHPLTPEDFQQWWTNDTTKTFLRALKNHREVLKEDVVRQVYENPEFACGKADAILEILEMSYENLQGLLSEK